ITKYILPPLFHSERDRLGQAARISPDGFSNVQESGRVRDQDPRERQACTFRKVHDGHGWKTRRYRDRATKRTWNRPHRRSGDRDRRSGHTVGQKRLEDRGLLSASAERLFASVMQVKHVTSAV